MKLLKSFLTQITIWATLCCLQPTWVFAQDNTDIENLNMLAEELQAEYETNYELALEVANAWDAPTTITLDSSIRVLQGIVTVDNGTGDEQWLVYYETTNIDAAQTLNVQDIWPAGAHGIGTASITAQSGNATNPKIGIWDGGAVRLTHDEFQNRVTQVDGATSSNNHATHVAGTMVAGGVNVVGGSVQPGMAYDALLDAYDWNNDASEMANAAANLFVSNHSYEFRFRDASGNWVDTHGWYSSHSRQRDNISYNAPYYLILQAAANSGPGFDRIGVPGAAKNSLTVGAVDDNGQIANFSSRGPADDGRIKPDVVGNGVGLLSCLAGSDNAYGSYSGTSMATPNVTGTLALLQEQYIALNSSEMRAATLKGLAIHTAKDLGNTGPDYIYGWGLVQANEAATVINQDATGQESILLEEPLPDGQTFQIEVCNDGTKPLKVTLSWTDLPALANPNPVVNPTVAPTTPALINDLDVRVSDGTTIYQPYVLDPTNPNGTATTGDNVLDNMEQIYISFPSAGTYTITVSHKGTLANIQQQFSLIVSGISDSIDCVSSNSPICHDTYLYGDSLDNYITHFSHLDEANQILYTVGMNPHITAIDLTNGNVLWAKNFSDMPTSIRDIAQAPNGELLIIGGAGNAGQEYYQVLRMDNNGIPIWQKDYSETTRRNRFGRIVQADGDNYFLLGWNGGGDDVGIIKIDGLGNELWSKRIHINDDEQMKGYERTATGGVVITGEDRGNNGLFLLEIDQNGIIGPVERYQPTPNYLLNGGSITQTLDGGYAITGISNANDQLMLLKIASDLSMSWVTTLSTGIAPTVEHRADDLVQDNQGNFYVMGKASSDGTQENFLMVKLDSLGNYIWSKSLQDNISTLLNGYGRSLYYTSSEELLWTAQFGVNTGWLGYGQRDFAWGITDTSFTNCLSVDVPLNIAQETWEPVVTNVTETPRTLVIDSLVVNDTDIVLGWEGVCDTICCPYSILSQDLECASVGDTVCIWLVSNIPLEAGITGLNYCLDYDPAVLTPTGNATLGNVVLNSGLYTQGTDAQINVNTNLSGFVFTTTNYLNTYTFESIADSVLCIEFVLNGPIANTNSLLSACELREAKGAILEDECVEDGSLTIQAVNNYLVADFVFALNTSLVLDNNNPIPGANTELFFMDSTCTDTLLTDYPDAQGNYTGNIANASHLIIERNIRPDDFFSGTCQVNMSGVLDVWDVLHLATVNNFDATSALATSFFGSNGTPDAVQMMAMDVNQNCELDGDDLTQLQSRIVGSVCEYQQLWNYDFGVVPPVPLLPAQESKDWVFIDANWLTTDPLYTAHTAYPNFPPSAGTGFWRDKVPVAPYCLPLCPTGDCCNDTLDFQFQGILLGDADGTWTQATNFKDEGTNYLMFDLNEAQDLGNGQYRIPVRYQTEATVYGIDFEMDYNESRLQIDTIVNTTSGAGFATVYNDFNNEELRLTAYTLAGSTTSEAVFYIDVTMLNATDVLSLSDLGEITGIVATLDGNTTEVSSIAVGIDDGNVASNHLAGVKAYPNPVSNRLVIDLPSDLNTTSSIIVRNMLGQVIFQTRTSDKHTLVDMSEMTAGVYLVSIETAEGLQDHIRVAKQ